MLSGPAETIGVPGEHCGGQSMQIHPMLTQILMLKMQKENYSHSSFIMQRHKEHLHAWGTIPHRHWLRSYPYNRQCHLKNLNTEISFLKTSHIYISRISLVFRLLDFQRVHSFNFERKNTGLPDVFRDARRSLA